MSLPKRYGCTRTLPEIYGVVLSVPCMKSGLETTSFPENEPYRRPVNDPHARGCVIAAIVHRLRDLEGVPGHWGSREGRERKLWQGVRTIGSDVGCLTPEPWR